MRTAIARALTVLLLLAPAACSEATPGVASPEAASGPIEAKVPVKFRPVVSQRAGTEASGPGELVGSDGNVYALGDPIGDFSRFKNVKAELTSGGSWGVIIDLVAEDQAAFGRWTTEHVGESVAIVVGDKVISAPQIASPITEGSVQITGTYSEQDARKLANQITGRS
ncbi:hypothetical protein V5P93_004951 [Actinokineospora auranticolor]|uniref:SecDF P1 head subdomain domain-containing protein n=1 Tax=Actinokineospora auranticolor TaxID=155976 RepID=A0A2S6GP56_9PSEU|nr:hypothetical protein [Actinokineospora auranticolor]PPK66911.1 hypothetical protein CLV40_109296 [Actinokineospora auranticolor]